MGVKGGSSVPPTCGANPRSLPETGGPQVPHSTCKLPALVILCLFGTCKVSDELSQKARWVQLGA